MPAAFILKDATADDLVTAVRVVAAGEALLAPTVTRRLIEEFAGRPHAHDLDLVPRPSAVAATS